VYSPINNLVISAGAVLIKDILVEFRSFLAAINDTKKNIEKAIMKVAPPARIADLLKTQDRE
jgi:hypothetical protein